MPLIPIEQALEEIRQGKMLIICDDEDRENEGDLYIPAENVTPEAVTFMATQGRGLICLAMLGDRLDLRVRAAFRRRRERAQHRPRRIGRFDLAGGKRGLLRGRGGSLSGRCDATRVKAARRPRLGYEPGLSHPIHDAWTKSPTRDRDGSWIHQLPGAVPAAGSAFL